MPGQFPTLTTPRLSLRPFVDRDLLPYVAYRNDPEIGRYQEWRPMTATAARKFIARYQRCRLGVPGQWYQIAIERKDIGELIGDCGLKVDAEEHRQVEIGYRLARHNHRQGFAKEAVSHLLDYVFDALDIHRVVAIAACKNDASVALLDRLGFRREGHLRQSFWCQGRWEDDYLYALLRNEWSEARELGHPLAYTNTPPPFPA